MLDEFSDGFRARFRRVTVAVAGACALALAVTGVAACSSGNDKPAAKRATTTTSPTTAATNAPTTAPSGSRPAAQSGPSAATTAVSIPGVDGPIVGPIPITAAGNFGNGVTARLTKIESVNAKTTLPGEFSGPAVALTLEVTNRSARSVNLDSVIVDLVYGENLSAYPVTDPNRQPLSGDLAAGDTTTGQYVFTLAKADRNHVQVRTHYAAGLPTIVFTGSVAG